MQIISGDCRAILKHVPDESVHCVVTSPPYWGLRDYGVSGQIGLEQSFTDYIETMRAVFAEVRRVLRQDGTLWLNMGDSYAGAHKTYNGQQAKWQHGEYPGNQECGYVLGASDGLKPKDLCGIPWRLAFALQADGWYLRSDIIWHKPNPMPESVTDRPTKAHEYLFLMSKSERYYYDAEAIKEDSLRVGDIPGGTGRYIQHSAGGHCKDGLKANGLANRNRRSVWTIATAPFPGAHFATFPPKLIEPCILAGCPQGGIVLDPFGGAGTTGLVAQRLGRRALLIELNPQYTAMAKRRIEVDHDKKSNANNLPGC